MVECGGLENRLARNPGHGGSNPPSSASLRMPQARETVPVLFYGNNKGIRTDEVDSRQENSPVGCFQRIARRL